MLGDSNLDVKLGLKNLLYKYLIQKSSEGTIAMHKLLQQVGREAVKLQKRTIRQILIYTNDICDALQNDSGSTSVMGISLDISTIQNSVQISAQTFRNMRKLRFLSIYGKRRDPNVRLHVPEDMYLSPLLKLLHWEGYPGKCLPHTFKPEYLLELNLTNNKLEKLWEGTQPLPNLKKMDFSESFDLKELPDLSNATNLERLILYGCWNLAEIPSSIGNLHKLEFLEMNLCLKLQVVPTPFNLVSLKTVKMVGCSQLRKFPDISTNITSLKIADTMLEESPESIMLWSRLQTLSIYGSAITYQLLANTFQEQSGADIKRIPDWIKDFHGLKELHIHGCPKLASLPELPGTLRKLTVETCESLESVFDSHIADYYFLNCFSLGQEARRVITQKSFYAYLPGKEIPNEFDHRAIGNSLSICPAVCKFRICLVLSPKPEMEAGYFMLFCRIRLPGCPIDENILTLALGNIRAKHHFIFHSEFFENHKEFLFKFSTSSHEVDVIECGVQILTDETDGSTINCGSPQCSEQLSNYE